MPAAFAWSQHDPDSAQGLTGGLEHDRLTALPLQEATQRFASRAGLPAEDRSCGDIQAVCQSLGCLPLALDLAAALYATGRIRPLSRLQQHLAVEQQRLDELRVEDVSVRAGFALVYRELGGRLQAIFDSLGAFVDDGWPLSAVTAVSGDTDAERGLGELVACSLAERREDGYGTHPVLHKFAREKLAARADAQEIHRRHAIYFLRYAQEKRAERDWLALERAGAELLAGQAWAEGAGECEMASSFGYASFEGFLVRGFHRRSLSVLHRARRAAQSASDQRATAAHLTRLGLVYREMGEVSKAIDYYEQALATYRQLDDRQGEADSLGNLGLVCYSTGDLSRAIDHHQLALAIHLETGYRRGEASSLGNLGLACRVMGNLARALSHHQEALAIYRQIGDRRGEADQLGNLGLVYRLTGDLPRASQCHQLALDISRGIGYRKGEADQLGHLGVVFADSGELPQAMQHHQLALGIHRELAYHWGAAVNLSNLGNVYYAMGDLQQAHQHYQKALDIDRAMGYRRAEATALCNLGVIYADTGQVSRALQCFEEALMVFEAIGMPLQAETVRSNIIELREQM
jgi:tetratricopeptide (TPR) repeat protein